jgi:CubicO group peptidase (beta-lactamase class C family)
MMNFEDFQKAWQCQKPVARATINAEALLREIRLEQRLYKAAYFWADMFIVGVEAILIPYFLYFGIRNHDWVFFLMAFSCFFIGVFILVDRWLQRRKRPITNDTLASSIKSSLILVKHEIWRSKNVFWWYVLPLEIGFGAVAVSWGWRLYARHEGWGIALATALGFAGWVLFCGLLGWSIYWSSQRGVEKVLAPRRKELEELLANLNENSSTASEPPPKKNSNMKTLLLILLLLVLFSTLVVIAVRAALPASGEIPHGLEAICKKHNLPALAVVVVKDGQICDRVAVGVRKWGDSTPLTTNDVFHIGSCTKSMTATLTAILIDEGKLRWDTTIAEVFPELKGKMDQQYEAVTVEQLLHHRGGVPGEPPPAAWKRAWEEDGTPTQQRREFIEAVLSQPPEAAPGTKMIYSNQGYAIVGAMLEKITGQDYEALITEKLFKPLHMDSAGFGPPGTTDKVDQPWGHVHKLLMTIPVQSDNPPAITPAGRVHCSLDDLARFAIFHLQYNATNGLLKPETLAKLHAPPAGANNISPMENYACGWVVLQRGWAGGTALWHNGSNTMWYIVMWLAPKKDFAVIAATNVAGPDAEQGCDDACVAMIHKWLPE